MVSVNPNVRFSYELVKGSPASRRQFVNRLNDQFFDTFVRVLDEKPCKPARFREEYKKLMPEEKNVKIRKFKESDDDYGVADYIYSEDDSILGLTLDLFSKGKLIGMDSLVTFLHENNHVLDALSNPKWTRLTEKLTKAGKYDESREVWYDTLLYHDESGSKRSLGEILESVKKGTLGFLSGKSFEDKIELLHDARYQLESERSAYAQQLKYAQKLKEMGKPVIEDDLVDWDKKYLFTEKLQVIKEIMIDLFKKEQEQIERNLEAKGK